MIGIDLQGNMYPSILVMPPALAAWYEARKFLSIAPPSKILVPRDICSILSHLLIHMLVDTIYQKEFHRQQG